MRAAIVALVVISTVGCRSIIGIEEPLSSEPSDPIVGFESQTSLHDERSTAVEIAVVLSHPAEAEVAVEWELGGGTAILGDDFDIVSEKLLFFSPGETRQLITLAIKADTIDAEGDETIRIDLLRPTNARIETASRQHLVTIDARLLPRLRFTVPSSSAPEGNPAQVDISIDEASEFEIEVDFTASGTASAPDYTPPGTLTIPAGNVNAGLTLATIEDALDEDNETVTLTLTNPRNVVIDETAKVHTHTLTDNDPPPTVAFNQAGSSSVESGTVTIALSLSAPSGRPISVSFVAGGSANNPSDYTIGASPITFAPGELTKNIVVNIVSDGVNEANETITLQLANPTNATLGTTVTYTLTINDND